MMLDADLAELYGVTSRRLAEQVRRNDERFPADFMFRLTAEERDELVELHPDLGHIKRSKAMPRAFTEHGALMLANVLNSELQFRRAERSERLGSEDGGSHEQEEHRLVARIALRKRPESSKRSTNG